MIDAAPEEARKSAQHWKLRANGKRLVHVPTKELRESLSFCGFERKIGFIDAWRAHKPSMKQVRFSSVQAFPRSSNALTSMIRSTILSVLTDVEFDLIALEEG